MCLHPVRECCTPQVGKVVVGARVGAARQELQRREHLGQVGQAPIVEELFLGAVALMPPARLW